MQLIYIYIEKFRNLNNIPISFSPTYNVSFDSSCGTISVKRKEKEDISDILYPNHIISVNAIVGRNATGKTNLLDLIALPENTRNTNSIWGKDEKASYFLLYAIEEGPFYYIEYMNEESANMLLPPLFQNNEEIWRSGWFSTDDNGMLFSIDAPQNQQHSCIISLREQLNKQYYDPEGVLGTEPTHYNERNKDAHTTYLNRLGGIYAYGNLRHELAAFVEMHPICHMIDSANAALLNDEIYKIALTWNHCTSYKPEWFPEFEDESIKSIRFLRRFALQVLCQTMCVEIKNNESTWTTHENKYHSFLFIVNSAENDADDLFWSYINNFVDFTIPSIFLTSFSTSKRKWLMEFFSSLAALPEDILEYAGNTIYIPLSIEKEQLSYVYPVLSCCTAESKDILQWSWLSTSDGEHRLIQGFASLRQLFEEGNLLTEKPPQNCILLLDEPELHSHPELARSFLSYVFRWLETITPRDSQGVLRVRYQLVIATHSPFILSDIDREHTLLFCRSAENTMTVGNPENQTFAANIHDILHDSIFLECPFGAVAYEKLKEIMDKFSDNGKSIPTTADKRLIELIGEPVLRSAFYQFLEDYS